jgi:hypothetical protein
MTESDHDSPLVVARVWHALKEAELLKICLGEDRLNQ